MIFAIDPNAKPDPHEEVEVSFTVMLPSRLTDKEMLEYVRYCLSDGGIGNANPMYEEGVDEKPLQAEMGTTLVKRAGRELRDEWTKAGA